MLTDIVPASSFCCVSRVTLARQRFAEWASDVCIDKCSIGIDGGIHIAVKIWQAVGNGAGTGAFRLYSNTMEPLHLQTPGTVCYIVL